MISQQFFLTKAKSIKIQMQINKSLGYIVLVVAPTAEVKKMDPDPGWRMAGPRLTTSLLTTEFPIPEHSSGKLLMLGKVQEISKHFFLKLHCPKRDRNFLKDFWPSL